MNELRVQVFDAEFNYQRQWPVVGWEGESVSNKPYPVVDGAGHAYVTDPMLPLIESTATGRCWSWADAGTTCLVSTAGWHAVSADGRSM